MIIRSRSTLPKFLDVFLFDLGEFTDYLGMVVLKRTVAVLHEHVLQVQEYLLLLRLTLYMVRTETTQDSTPNPLLNLLLVILLGRSLAPLPLPHPHLPLLLRHHTRALHLHLLLLQGGLELSQVIHVLFLFLPHHRFRLLRLHCSLGHLLILGSILKWRGQFRRL